MVMSVICLLGGIAASFVPETLGSELPETLEEAANFGSQHKYFSWMPDTRGKKKVKEEEKTVVPT